MILSVWRRARDTVAGPFLRMSPRERLLVGIMALVALILAPIKAFDLAQDARERLLDAQTQVETARQAANGGSAVLDRRVAKATKEVEDWSWKAPSVPVAQVLAQQQIGVLAREAGMADAEIKTSDDIKTAGAVRLVRLEVSATFNWTTYLKFLTSVADLNKAVMVASTSVEGDPLRARIVLDLPVILETPAAQ